MKPLSVHLPISILLAAFAGCSAASGPGYETGNGGDRLQIVFEKARELARRKLSTLRPCALPERTSPEAAAWLNANLPEIARDVSDSRHEWSASRQSTCASTETRPGSTIRLSLVSCADVGVDEAAELLIHESIHHLGQREESLATQAARAVFSASEGNCIPAESEVRWLDDPSDLLETVELKGVTVEGSGICYEHSPLHWPSIPAFDFTTEGNYWVIAHLDQGWTASTYEWLSPRDELRSSGRCEENNASTLAVATGKKEFRNWKPKPGERVGFFLSTPNRLGYRGPLLERSNIVWIRWK